MTIHYLEQLIGDKDALLDRAMQHPAMALKRKPTMETAMKAVVAELELVASKAVRAEYEPKLQEVYDMYTLMNGEYADSDDKDNWSEGMDEKVEELFAPLNPVLSQDWLGRYTIDTHLYEDQGVEKLADALGKEVFRSLAYGKEPGQTLANAGILRDHVQAVFNSHTATLSTPEGKAAQAERAASGINDVVANIKAHLGIGFDPLEVMADLELVCTEDDEILVGGAAQRLGMDQDDINGTQLYALEIGGKEAFNAIWGAINAKGETAVLPAPLPERSNKPRYVQGDAAAVLNPAQVLTLLKEHSAISDNDLAATAGLSRTTLLKYINGEGEFAPDQTQREALRGVVLRDLNALYKALCFLDNTQVDRTWE